MNSPSSTYEKIGHYQILESLGKGGMGEVYLAYDPICKRKIALKQIRQELKDHPVIKERFLREASVAAQLIHPSIVPIFFIDLSVDRAYYTMPYVEGETLKQILKTSLNEEKDGEVKHPLGSSILSLTRIFLSVCEGIAYTHSKGIVHRDLKPDNIIVGKYGEVLLLDWGLADFIGKAETFIEEEVNENYKDLTRPGKVPGTLNYIAPERLCGGPSQVTVDIYSLGVILYQLLTLRVPFQRTSVKHFRKTMHLEKLPDPFEMAPYRDIPQHLADIAKRCLRYNPCDRFQSVDEIIVEIKNFLEGKPEWIPVTQLHIENKQDWEFQENVLLAKHTAITRSPDVMEWVSLMISRASFSGRTKVETRIKMTRECQGIGILLGIPEAIERKELNQGYCLWLGRECRLFHHDVEVMMIPEISMDDNAWHEVRLEKIDHHLFVFLDQRQICHYISQTPLIGTRVGLICRDADFEIEPLNISSGSQNVMVNCLAIPDAFLANKNYAKALLEYRRIATSFAGRTEGREALFRAGVTLLEEASACQKRKEKERLYHLALEEFSKLRNTPAQPLEYLGKSLVYKATYEIEEEIKCLELCLRKYPRHPLLNQIREHIAFRLHETSSRDRVAAYHFALLSLRHMPQIFHHQDNARLISSLKAHLEPLPFLLYADPGEEYLACQLAFWLCKPILLVEMIETSHSPAIVANCLYALLAMGRTSWVEENLHDLEKEPEEALIRIALLHFKRGPSVALTALLQQLSSPVTFTEQRCAHFLFDRALLEGKSQEVLAYFKHFPQSSFLVSLEISSLLMQNEWKKAQQLLETYPIETLTDEYSPLFVPMGCYLRHCEGESIALSHFSGSIDLPHPPTTMLLSDYLRGKWTEKREGFKDAFPWEKIALLRQLVLYFHSAGAWTKQKNFAKRLKKELKYLAYDKSSPYP